MMLKFFQFGIFVCLIAELAIAGDVKPADGLRFVTVDNENVGVVCVLARKMDPKKNNEVEWKVFRKGKPELIKDPRIVGAKAVGQSVNKDDPEEVAVQTAFAGTERKSIKEAIEALSLIPSIGEADWKWNVNIDDRGIIAQPVGHEMKPIRFHSAWQFHEILGYPDDKLTLDRKLAVAEALEIPDSSLDTALEGVRSILANKAATAVIRSVDANNPEEAIVVTEEKLLLCIPYVHQDDFRVLKSMFDSGSGVEEIKEGISSKHYQILRSVALVPRYDESGNYFMNSDFGWTLNNGDNSNLRSWNLERHVSQTTWLVQHKYKLELTDVAKAARSSVAFGLKDFDFDSALGVQQPENPAASSTIVDKQICPDRFELKLGAHGIPFHLVKVDDHPVYVMDRHLTVGDLYAFMRTADPKEDEWWRTRASRENRLLPTGQLKLQQGLDNIVRTTLQDIENASDVLGKCKDPETAQCMVAVRTACLHGQVQKLHALVGLAANAQDSFIKWQVEQTCREIEKIRDLAQLDVVFGIEAKSSPQDFADGERGFNSDRAYSSLFGKCRSMDAALTDTIFKRYQIKRRQLAVDLPEPGVDPKGQPICCVSWELLSKILLGTNGTSGRLTVPSTPEWVSIAATVDENHRWSGNRLAPWPLPALKPANIEQSIAGNLAVVVFENGMMGGFYRDGDNRRSDVFLPLNKSASSPTAGFRLVFRGIPQVNSRTPGATQSTPDIAKPEDKPKSKSIKADPVPNASRKAIDALYRELFGSAPAPGKATPAWNWEQQHVKQYFGDSDHWLVEHLRDVLWGTGDHKACKDELPDEDFIQDATRVVFGSNGSAAQK